MAGSIRRLVAVARTGFVLMVVAAIVAGLAGPNAAPRAAAEGTGLEVLGELDLGCPDGTGTPGKSGIHPLGIEPDARRLYVWVNCSDGNRIIVHDLSTDIPTVVQVGPLIDDSELANPWNPNTTVVSLEQRRIFVLGYTGVTDPADSIIEVYDLETLKRMDDPWKASERTPGFFWAGLAHDPDRGRIYLLGELGHRATYEGLNIGQTRGNPPQAAIAAINDTSGELKWIDHLDGCETPLNSNFHGGVVKMSASSKLYALCVGAAQHGTATGQGGLVRLDVSQQGDADPVVADFPSDFFPVSGDYTSGDGGVAGLDPKRERFFAHSLSEETHGAWVFDGKRSSWVGFVAAPDATNSFIGVDPTTGKHYMGGGTTFQEQSGYINVTDGGATPVPQGRLYDDIRSDTPWAREVDGSLTINGNMLVDPPTGRLFVKYRSVAPTLSGALVLRDTTPPIVPRTPTDLDKLTHDLPVDEARLEFSANTSGFGAQYVQVGGWENVYTRPRFGRFDQNVKTTLDMLAPRSNPANLRYGNRGATMSLVEGIGIAESGASASAIATRPDDTTPADVETKQNNAENQANDATDGGVDDLSAAAEEASSDDDDSDDEEIQEARYVTCLDGAGEEPVDDEDPEEGGEASPAYAKVVCDLANLETTAHAHFSGGSGGGGVFVSDSRFDARTYRDPERGTVSEAEAVAEGIFFGEADVGGFGIDRVTSTVTTVANGLDGTSYVKWVRTVEGMRTFAADGTINEEPESCTTTVETGKEVTEEGGCESLQKDLNDLIPNRFEVRFPMPEWVATPGGAYAEVKEAETDFLSGKATYNDERDVVPGMEMTVFADGPQRGRTWVQLAAVKARSKFIRHEVHEFEPWPDVDERPALIDEGGATEPTATSEVDVPPDSGGTTVAAPPSPDEPEVAEEPSMTIASHEARLVGGFGWVPALRSLGDAVLAGALYLVFLLPFAEIVRRRRLLDVLTDGGPADESSPSARRSPAKVSGSPVSVST